MFLFCFVFLIKDNLNENFSIYCILNFFSLSLNFRIPFTIQRLCELLTEPKRNYTGTDKFLRGVEKVRSKQYVEYIYLQTPAVTNLGILVSL